MNSSTPKNFATLMVEINASIWPDGPPENLKDPIKDSEGNIIAPSPLRMLYMEGMTTIAMAVPCERLRNADVHEFGMTLFKTGMTVVAEPRGIITRVYTIANGNWDDPVFYTDKEWPEPEAWGMNILNQWQNPENAGVTPPLTMGLHRAETSLDRDVNSNVIGRARTGIFAKEDGRVWVAPWMQSNERLVIEWKGLKKEWNDHDLVNDGLDYRKALKLFVQFAYERDFGDERKAAIFYSQRPPALPSGHFADALADLIVECQNRMRRTPAPHQSKEVRDRVPTEINDDALP